MINIRNVLNDQVRFIAPLAVVLVAVSAYFLLGGRRGPTVMHEDTHYTMYYYNLATGQRLVGPTYVIVPAPDETGKENIVRAIYGRSSADSEDKLLYLEKCDDKTIESGKKTHGGTLQAFSDYAPSKLFYYAPLWAGYGFVKKDPAGKWVANNTPEGHEIMHPLAPDGKPYPLVFP